MTTPTNTPPPPPLYPPTSYTPPTPPKKRHIGRAIAISAGVVVGGLVLIAALAGGSEDEPDAVNAAITVASSTTVAEPTTTTAEPTTTTVAPTTTTVAPTTTVDPLAHDRAVALQVLPFMTDLESSFTNAADAGSDGDLVGLIRACQDGLDMMHTSRPTVMFDDPELHQHLTAALDQAEGMFLACVALDVDLVSTLAPEASASFDALTARFTELNAS